MRVAEEVSCSTASRASRMILGLGRGAARSSSRASACPWCESGSASVEYAQMLLEGLEKGYCELHGEFVSQRGRTSDPHLQELPGAHLCRRVSPESMKIMAELGVGILIIPAEAVERGGKELTEYHALYRQSTASSRLPRSRGLDLLRSVRIAPASRRIG